MTIEKRDPTYIKVYDGYCRLQSESYEWITRTIAMHNWVQEAYRLYKENPKRSADERYIIWQPIFDRIYEHLFGPFFRPFRVFLMPMVELWRFQVEFLEQTTGPSNPFLFWAEQQAQFVDSMVSSFQSACYPKTEIKKDTPDFSTIDSVRELSPLRLLRKATDEEVASCLASVESMVSSLGENQFMLPKDFIINLEKAVASMPSAYKTARQYEALFRTTWDKSTLRFTHEISNQPAMNDFKPFFDAFRAVLSEDYQKLFTSHDFIQVQSNFMKTISEFTVYLRKAMEASFTMFPALPFATDGELDDLSRSLHSYKRRMDKLERRLRDTSVFNATAEKFNALEQRIKELEEKLEVESEKSALFHDRKNRRKLAGVA